MVAVKYTWWSSNWSGSAIFSALSDGDVQKHIEKTCEQLNVFCHRSLYIIINEKMFINKFLLLSTFEHRMRYMGTTQPHYTEMGDSGLNP